MAYGQVWCPLCVTSSELVDYTVLRCASILASPRVSHSGSQSCEGTDSFKLGFWMEHGGTVESKFCESRGYSLSVPGVDVADATKCKREKSLVMAKSQGMLWEGGGAECRGGRRPLSGDRTGQDAGVAGAGGRRARTGRWDLNLRTRLPCWFFFFVSGPHLFFHTAHRVITRRPAYLFFPLQPAEIFPGNFPNVYIW